MASGTWSFPPPAPLEGLSSESFPMNLPISLALVDAADAYGSPLADRVSPILVYRPTILMASSAARVGGILRRTYHARDALAISTRLLSSTAKM